MCSVFVVRFAEMFETVAKLNKNLRLCANDDSEEVFGKETLRRESQAVLLR